MKTTTHITTTEEKIQHSVNLLHVAKQGPQTARKGKIVIDKRKIPLLDRILNSSPKVANMHLEIEVVTAHGLKIRDISKVLQISVIGDNQDNKEITIQQHETPYVVEFFADEIIDCELVETCGDGSENSLFPINYIIYLKRDGEIVTSLECSIDVRIEPFGRVEPAVKFVPVDKYKNGIVYNRINTDPITIGHIHVKNAGAHYRTPAINTFISIDGLISEDIIPNLIFLGNKPESVGGRPVLNPRLLAEERGNVGAAGSCSSCSIDNGRADIAKLPVETASEHYIRIPVLLDMSRLSSNPANDETISIQALSIFRKYYESIDTKNRIVSEVGTILLKRNTLIMEMEVFAGPEGATFTTDSRIKNGETRDLSAEYYGWTSEEQVHPTLSYEFIINNSAEANEEGKGDASIIIKDIQVKAPTVADGAVIELQQGKFLFGDMFSVGAFEKGTIHLTVSSGMLTIPVTYTDEFLVSIKSVENKTIYNAHVIIPISFKYCIDKEGLYSADPDAFRFKEFNSYLRFRIFKRARPEWFCLDFGTSAVVASYAQSLNEEESRRLIPLQKIKEDFDSKVWKTNVRAREDAGEGSEFLISSTAVLQSRMMEETLKQPNDYGNAAVLFSPPSIGYTEYYNRLLPCLKSLVGNDIIPNELIPSGTKHRDKIENRVKVNDVLTVIYSQLFKFFLPNRVRNTERMVLTFPNTFAPVHINKIKEIAASSLRELRPDYLRFLSESDAVAFYYNHHRQSFIQNTPSLNVNDDFDKHVLVYDMGAGTLDLTYFIRSKVKTGKTTYKTRISIEGKMGVNKAGNYLDFVLAEILVDLICEKKELDDEIKNKIHSLMDLKGAAISRSLKDASLLKGFVKDNIKLHLDEPKDTAIEGDLILFGTKLPVNEITIGEIVSDARYTSFIDDVTTDVFKNFLALFGKGDEDSRFLPIDLVIFSGRTTGILSLRNAVNKSLSIFGQQDKETLFADLSAKMYTGIGSPIKNITTLKTVVVDGALAYCRGKSGFELVNTNIYATYGVFLIDNQGAAEWLPLIDYRTKPVGGKQRVSDDGITIKEYDSQRHRAKCTSPINPDDVDLSNYQEIIIAQTYSRAPLEDWKNGKKELISVIGAVHLDGGGAVCQLRMKVDAQNNLIFNINNQPQRLLYHDDYESESFARAMWPLVRVIREQSNENTEELKG